jgi:hypothetical protein
VGVTAEKAVGLSRLASRKKSGELKQTVQSLPQLATSIKKNNSKMSLALFATIFNLNPNNRHYSALRQCNSNLNPF